MLDLKKAFQEIETWYQNSDTDKINFLIKNRNYYNNSYEYKFKRTITWYLEVKISDKKDLILGNKIISLEDFGNFVLETKIFPVKKDYIQPDESIFDYDIAGYATLQLINKIENFWKNLTGNDVFFLSKDMILEKYGLDLSGGRLYLDNDLKEYTFNYIYYNLNFFLSRELMEEWYKCSYYGLQEVCLPDTNMLEKIVNEQVEKDRELKVHHFNEMIDDFAKNFKNDLFFQDKLNEIQKIKFTI